ncbi:MFS transporter [Actinorhabdospora filicis]|uniref:MFS transporter n=1 Tax=Actinorhabdospora filicis TaxID=1785913 RepID=A0A9W6W9F6_9ACTN|nr:MFS transporter [Actinorhabdospora filicis]GLZ77481.1 MFS transporter [Actinorhabdospora filicis]
MSSDRPRPASRFGPFLLATGTLLSSTSFFLMLPVVPLYVIHVAGSGDFALAGVALGASFLVSSLSSPIWGRLTDRFGARPMMLRSAFGLAIVYALFPLAQTVALVIAVRILNGLVAGYTPAAFTLATRVTPPERLGRALTGLSVARNAGGLLGPALGGLLVAYAGFTEAFLAASVITVGAGLVVLPLKEERKPRNRERTEPMPLLPRLGREGYVALTLTMVTVAATSMLSITLPLLLGLAESDAQNVARNFGVLQSLSALIALALGMAWGWLADRGGYARLVPAVFVTSGILLAVLGLMQGTPSIATVYLLYSAVQCEAMTLIVMYLAAVVPSGLRGSAMGLQNSAQQMGSAIGPVLGGAVVFLGGIRPSFWVSAALLGLCCATFLLARRHLRSQPAAENDQVETGTG